MPVLAAAVWPAAGEQEAVRNEQLHLAVVC